MQRALLVLAIVLVLPLLVNAEATSDLSKEDLRYIEFFNKNGVMEKSGINFDDIPPNKHKMLLEMLKMETGVDDLDFIESEDDRFASPEKTWDLYKASFLSGDMDLCNKCLMPTFRKKHDSFVKVIGFEEMKHEIAAMKPIQKIIEEGSRAKYRIRREINGNEITFYIDFKNVFGKWRIMQY